MKDWAYEVPGLLDLQVNGVAGIDLTATPERLWDVAAALPRFGVTAFLATIITSNPTAAIDATRVLAEGPPDGWAGATPLGLHLEGPMLAPERRGAHPIEWLRPPSRDLVEAWSRDDGVTLVTLAPELPGALEVIATLTERNVVVSIGHTQATSAEVERAAAAGARCLTHLGNAMPPMVARSPGPIGVALSRQLPDLYACCIVDGTHSDPAFIAAVWHSLGPDRFISVSDATAGLGIPDGPSSLGAMSVEVTNGRVTLSDGTLAGSATPLIECVRNLVDYTGCSLGDALSTANTNPYALLGLSQPDGDRILLDEDYRLVATYIDDRLVHEAT